MVLGRPLVWSACGVERHPTQVQRALPFFGVNHPAWPSALPCMRIILIIALVLSWYVLVLFKILSKLSFCFLFDHPGIIYGPNDHRSYSGPFWIMRHIPKENKLSFDQWTGNSSRGFLWNLSSPNVLLVWNQIKQRGNAPTMVVKTPKGHTIIVLINANSFIFSLTLVLGVGRPYKIITISVPIYCLLNMFTKDTCMMLH